jgi:hypothetical protein
MMDRRGRRHVLGSTSFRARLIASAGALALVGLLVLVGCGGGDESSSERSATKPGASEGTTGATGATGTTGARDSDRTRRGDRKKQRPGQDTGGAKSAPGSAPAPPTEPSEPSEPSGQASPTAPSLTSDPRELKRVRREFRKQARVACRAFGIEQLAEDLHTKSRKPDAVARAYAASYHVDIRRAVTAGCKAGLLESGR